MHLRWGIRSLERLSSLSVKYTSWESKADVVNAMDIIGVCELDGQLGTASRLFTKSTSTHRLAVQQQNGHARDLLDHAVEVRPHCGCDVHGGDVALSTLAALLSVSAVSLCPECCRIHDRMEQSRAVSIAIVTLMAWMIEKDNYNPASLTFIVQLYTFNASNR